MQDTETDLVYMQQRYYDPIAGRFLSADPIVADAATGKLFGRFHYAENNPYRYVDPDGRVPSDQWYEFNNNQRFKDWVHGEKMKDGRGAAQNYSHEDLRRLHREWVGLGEPRGKGGKSGFGGRQRGVSNPAVLTRVFVFLSLALHSGEPGAGEQESIDKFNEESERFRKELEAARKEREGRSGGDEESESKVSGEFQGVFRVSGRLESKELAEAKKKEKPKEEKKDKK